MILRVLIGVAGVLLVAGCLADMVNTLVATHTSSSRYWFASRLYNYGWKLVGFVVRRSRSDRFRNFVLTSFAPVSVLALLVGWIVQEIIGWGLIWFAIGGLKGAESLGDSMYFSGVVYFTVGFGEIVPTELVPRIGALLEAFCGVLTTALVIGYLPALFAAYSERERRLMSLDDGTEQRITPINLLLSRAAPGNPEPLDTFFKEWEEWTAAVLSTHSTYPMLRLFRSQQSTQHWITALGLVCDTASIAQCVLADEYRNSVWLMRRGIRLFESLTEGVDLCEYEERFDAQVAGAEFSPVSSQLRSQLEAGGFELRDSTVAREESLEYRRRFSPAMEYLIDELFAPRGFWPHAVGLPVFAPGQVGLIEAPPPEPDSTGLAIESFK